MALIVATGLIKPTPSSCASRFSGYNMSQSIILRLLPHAKTQFYPLPPSHSTLAFAYLCRARPRLFGIRLILDEPQQLLPPPRLDVTIA